MRQILVKPDQMAVSNEDTVLVAKALGSSLAVCLYDGSRHIGGLVHTLLPSVGNKPESDSPRFVEGAVEALYKEILKRGADPPLIRAKLVGGARLFLIVDQTRHIDIGSENIWSARRTLQELGVPVESEDTGENYGRNIYFYAGSGRLEIETVSHSSYII